MKVHQIKALVKWDWDHPNCKFKPRDRVRVVFGCLSSEGRYNRSYSEEYQNHYGEVGTVIAVSCTKFGTIRSARRQYTRYYVLFDNGDVVGYHSNHIEKLRETPTEVTDFQKWLLDVLENDDMFRFTADNLLVKIVKYSREGGYHSSTDFERGPQLKQAANLILEELYNSLHSTEDRIDPAVVTVGAEIDPISMFKFWADWADMAKSFFGDIQKEQLYNNLR